MALDRSLDDFDLNQTYHNVDSLQVCVEMCVPRNKYLAYNQQTHLCICMAIMPIDVASKRVPHEKCVTILKRDDASNLMEMYHTGFLGKNKIFDIFFYFTCHLSIFPSFRFRTKNWAKLFTKSKCKYSIKI